MATGKARDHIAREMKRLGLSFGVVAIGTGLARSSIHRIAKDWRANQTQAKIVESFLQQQEQSGAEVVKKDLRARFFPAGGNVAVAASTLREPLDDLIKGINLGAWRDQELLEKVEEYIAELQEAKKKKMITKISVPEEILDHYGLRRDPFTNEMDDDSDILDTRYFKEAEKKIMNAIDKNGWVAVTGRVGSGKSTLIKKVEQRLQRDRRKHVVVKPRTIEKQYLRASHVCDSILGDLGVYLPSGMRTLEGKARVVGRTLEEQYRDGCKVILLIDEAHLLANDALLALKRLFEIEIGFKKLLSIVLVGQDVLARRLKTDFTISEVSQRVDLYEMSGLNGSTGAYIRHKLEKAGASKEIFDNSAIKAIADSADTPLSVNNLAATALIGAHDLGQKQVDGALVKSIQGRL